jgi:hypothetical protein
MTSQNLKEELTSNRLSGQAWTSLGEAFPGASRAVSPMEPGGVSDDLLFVVQVAVRLPSKVVLVHNHRHSLSRKTGRYCQILSGEVK